jgi:hypothetical protein
MLPGFRFLFAAILLSTSILVFGLGAAALLRASHEQYANNPSWLNGPQEQRFAQASEPAPPMLAVLRAEPEVTAEPEPSLRDLVPTIGLPATEPEQVAALTTEADIQADVQAAAPDAEPAKAETTTEAATPAPADTLTPADTTASIPEAKPELKPDLGPAAVATAEPAPTDSAALASSALDIATAKLAALNELATTAVKDPPAKAKPESKPDDKATKRKAKARKRHRVVRRPPPQQLQQQLDPFGQPQTFATTAATRSRQ